MPNAKRNRRPRGRPEPTMPGIVSCLQWFMRDVAPFLRPPRAPARAARHLRNAGIEVLEAIRALLDETIEWLRHEKPSPELRRIRVED